MTPAHGRYFFAVLTGSHVRMLSGAARRLRDEGFDCRFVELDNPLSPGRAKAALKAAALSSIPLAEAEAQLEPGDILVVGNAWAPDPLVGLLARRRQRSIVAVGVVEGCRFAKEDHYRNVDHVLGWGPSCLDYFPETGVVVGSPEIEAAWQSTPSFVEPPFAAINYKFVYERQAGRAKWIDIVRQACDEAGLAMRFSRHPADVGDDPLNLPTEELSDLLRDGALLITRPSTTVYQAMAAGKPVVLLPMSDEDLGEFAEPMGAYERPKSPAELLQLIRQALGERGSYRERCRAFFERHVSIEPGNPAAERMAAALRRINL